MLADLFRALRAHFLADPTLVSLATGGLFLHLAAENAATPYVIMRQRPGGEVARNAGKTQIETVVIRFEVYADSFDPIDQILEAMVERFELASLIVAGRPAILVDSQLPPVVEQADLGRWIGYVDFHIVLHRVRP